MKIFLPAIFCVFLIFANGCSNLDTIESPSKSISDVGDLVFVKGRWEKTTSTNVKALSLQEINDTVIPKMNYTSITCNKIEMRCYEIMAFLFTPEDSALLKKRKLLYADSITYTIIDWSNDIIRAKNATPVAEWEIKISMKDKFAERSFRETKTRGSDTANPDIYEHWILK